MTAAIEPTGCPRTSPSTTSQERTHNVGEASGIAPKCGLPRAGRCPPTRRGSASHVAGEHRRLEAVFRRIASSPEEAPEARNGLARDDI